LPPPKCPWCKKPLWKYLRIYSASVFQWIGYPDGYIGLGREKYRRDICPHCDKKIVLCKRKKGREVFAWEKVEDPA